VNCEALFYHGRNLFLIENQQSTAVEMYHWFGFDEDDRPYWGYCVVACSDFTNESLLLIQVEEEDAIGRALSWVLRDSMYTWKQAELFYDEQYVGPSKEVMCEIVALFRDVFKFSTVINWTDENG